MDCFVAALLAMTEERGASRHCERSEAIHATRKNGLLRRCAPLRKRFAFVAGNDGGALVQNAARTPPLAVMVRLWSDIIVPSTAPNSATFAVVW